MNQLKIPSENRRKNMEPPRSIGGTTQRKPLADCTNTVSRSSQQPSSSVKFSNPSLTSALRRIVDQTSLKDKTNHARIPVAASETASSSLAANGSPVPRRIPADLSSPTVADQTTSKEKDKDVNDSDSASKVTSRSLATNSRRVTRRMSSDLGFPASAPPPTRPENFFSDQGVSEKELDAPYSVYTVRRKASGRKRNNDASSSSSAVAPLRLDLKSSSGKKTRQANENKSKPLRVAPKKKRRTVKTEKANLVHGVPKDYIEKQKAYFAEIDAFELEEEEVTSFSDLD